MIPKEYKTILETCYSRINSYVHFNEISKIVDIRIGGSRVYGFYKDTSDVDIIILVQFTDSHFNSSIDMVPLYGKNVNDDILFDKLKLSTILRSEKLFLERKYLGYRLPTYSLIHKKVYDFSKKDLLNYIEMRKQLSKDWIENRKYRENICNIGNIYVDS